MTTPTTGGAVAELEYEVFTEMAERTLAELAAEAAERWDVSVALVHRTGVVPLGEAAVVIVTAAAHRVAAYEANRHLIEAIKQRLPIWKRERFVDGASGSARAHEGRGLARAASPCTMPA